MRKTIGLSLVLFLSIMCVHVSAEEHRSANSFTPEDHQFVENQIIILDEIIAMHKFVKDIHPALEKLYPVSIVNGGYLFVFDLNEAGDRYEIRYKEETFLPKENMIAAFPLADDFPSAVVSKNILEDPANYVFIFHEFVHCYQWNNGETELKNNLLIEKQETAKNNYSWEINYPFPYDDQYFVNDANSVDEYYRNDDLASMIEFHRNMKSRLQQTDFEYMIWQEWKEGFARYVENLIRAEMNLAKNSRALIPPFERTSFYETGNRYIEMLIKKDETLRGDMEKLFSAMLKFPPSN